MAVRLRLSRVPFTRNRAQYNLVATNSTKRATAKPLEVLGTFSPRPVVEAPISVSPNGQRRAEVEWGPRQFGSQATLVVPPHQRTKRASGAPDNERQLLETVGAKQVEWNVERVKHWLNIGAVPTKPVERLLNKAGVIRERQVFTVVDLHNANNFPSLAERKETSTFTRPQDKPVSRLTRINRAVRAAKQAEAKA
ncbi:37S ribosomal protein S16, mitochondrial [Microbotryomycetes sp. JL201]|nr:37S ribosomal protein S16, mitochondrial [Microbotryomycetes sp. JL201]